MNIKIEMRRVSKKRVTRHEPDVSKDKKMKFENENVIHYTYTYRFN